MPQRSTRRQARAREGSDAASGAGTAGAHERRRSGVRTLPAGDRATQGPGRRRRSARGSRSRRLGRRARRRSRGRPRRRTRAARRRGRRWRRPGRDGVGDLAEEVGEHDDLEGGRRAERVEHAVEHGHVEAPPGDGAEQPRVGGPQVADGRAHGPAEHGADRAQATGAVAGHPQSGADGERHAERGEGRGQRGQGERPFAGDGQHAAGHRDRGQEDRVHEHEEGQQRAVAPRVPRPERRSAHKVIAAPPTPAVGSSRVAAAPPRVISVVSRRPSRAEARLPTSHSVAM